MDKLGDILSDPTLYTTSVLALLTDQFGTEFLEWDPLTIDMELQSVAGIEPSEALLDKIQAGSSLFTTNLFFLSLEAFSATCNTLNFGVTTSNSLIHADLDDALWGVTEASILLGSDYDMDEFSHNISKFVGVLLAEEGIVKPPQMLSFAEVDKDLADKSEAAFGEDDEMRMAFWRNQQEDNRMLDQTNYAKIISLMNQLTKLPLKNGNSDFVQATIARLQGAMQS